MRQLLTLLIALFLASASWPQEAEEPGDTEAAVDDATEAADATEDEDDSDLDEQGYGTEEEEDDFIPSQEVSADQSVAFPVDI
jgi:hypothetical protein